MLPRSISQFIAIVILFLIVQGTIILTLALTAFPIRDDFAGMSKVRDYSPFQAQMAFNQRS